MQKIDNSTLKRIETFSIARLALLCLMLFTSIFLRQEVLGTLTILKIYVTLTVSFFLSIINLTFWNENRRLWQFLSLQFIYDILLTSYLVFLTGISESIFLFIYLLNIAFASIVFQTLGTLAVAALAGSIYGIVFYINADGNSQATIYNLAYSELLFLLTALLCGQLMDELKKQKLLLEIQLSSIKRLELLNNQLLNNIPVGILVIDYKDFVQSLNQTALKFLGLKKVPEILLKYYELLPSIKGVPESWERLPEKKKVRFHFVHKIDEKSQKQFSLQVVPFPKIDSGIEDNRFILMIQDVSKTLELEEKLEFESKLAATGQLVAGVAHEIRNPLASISGSIETLNSHLKLENEEDQKLIAISLRETRRLNQLITEFLEFAKPKANNTAIISLQEKVQEVVEAIHSRSKDNELIHFDIQIAKELTVSADPERIKQVFFNLFINSIEALKEQKTQITVKAVLDQDEVKIDITDNGPGIPEDISRKIFDPFFTTKGTGTGLGLSTVAQVLKASRGTINLIPSSSGTHFQIYLPTSAAT